MAMLTARESICCKEIQECSYKLEELDLDASVVCITQHPGFNSVCLDPWVLETVTNAVCQSYVSSQAGNSQNEQYRYVAYCQLALWCWGYLGKHIRVVLPSCAVQRIRTNQYLYLDPEYNGEVVVAWIVLVAMEIILMFIVLFLSVRRCAGRNGEANIGVGLYLTIILAWALIASIEVCIVCMTVYIGLRICPSEISTFATPGLNYHLLKLFCAGIGITGVSLFLACLILFGFSVGYCSRQWISDGQL